MRPRNDAGDPPPEVALAASRRLGSRRKDFPDHNRTDNFFWQRRRQPVVEPAAGQPFGNDDGREGRAARRVYSLVRHAGHRKGFGDSREGASGHGTSFYRGGSAGGSAHRFFLGP